MQMTMPMTTSAYQVAFTDMPPSTSRTIARHMMKTLARTRIAPSASAARCSAFPWPYWWPGSAGRTATPPAKKVSSAAMRSVPEWAASEMRPRLCVARPVPSLSAISASAANTDQSAAFRWASTPGSVRPPGAGARVVRPGVAGLAGAASGGAVYRLGAGGSAAGASSPVERHACIEGRHVVDPPHAECREPARRVDAEEPDAGQAVGAADVRADVQLQEGRDPWYRQRPTSPQRADAKEHDAEPAAAVVLLDLELVGNALAEIDRRDRPVRPEDVLPGLAERPAALGDRERTVPNALQRARLPARRPRIVEEIRYGSLVGLRPAMVRASLAAAKRRAAVSSVAPIASAIDAPCVLASLAFHSPGTRNHHRT